MGRGKATFFTTVMLSAAKHLFAYRLRVTCTVEEYIET